MHWGSDEIREVIRFPIEGSADELGSSITFIAKGDVTDGEVPGEIQQEFIKKDFDFGPLRPYNSQEYYDVDQDQIKSLDKEQYVRYDEPMLHCLNILTDYPLAIVTHPDDENYGIVMPADFNSRIAKEYLYPFFAEAARSVSNLIETRYDSIDLIPIYLSNRNNGEAANRWARAMEDNVELHIAEFMNLTDLKVIMTELTELREEIDLTSKTRCRDIFDDVARFRDKVMHANRTMVDSQEDIQELAESIDATAYLTRNCSELLES
jgi:hypothetical protein